MASPKLGKFVGGLFVLGFLVGYGRFDDRCVVTAGKSRLSRDPIRREGRIHDTDEVRKAGLLPTTLWGQDEQGTRHSVCQEGVRFGRAPIQQVRVKAQFVKHAGYGARRCAQGGKLAPEPPCSAPSQAKTAGPPQAAPEQPARIQAVHELERRFAQGGEVVGVFRNRKASHDTAQQVIDESLAHHRTADLRAVLPGGDFAPRHHDDVANLPFADGTLVTRRDLLRRRIRKSTARPNCLPSPSNPEGRQAQGDTGVRRITARSTPTRTVAPAQVLANPSFATFACPTDTATAPC